MDPEQQELLRDSRLSDAARVLGLHISMLGDGDHELPYDRLAALLHGTPNPDTVGRHMRQLLVHGYVERTSLGGSGSPRYRWCARENSRGEEPSHSPSLENSRASEPLPAIKHGEEPPAGGGFMGGETPPTSQPTNPPAGSRTSKATAVELDPLRSYLGEHAGAVDVFAASAEHRGSWAAALLGKYGPNGTLRHFWRGIPAEREPAIVADALLNYASDSGGTAYDARLFEAYLRRSRDGAPEKPARASPRADVAPDSQSARIMARSSDPTPGAGRAQQPRRSTNPEPVQVDPFAQYQEQIAALTAEEQATLRKQARAQSPKGATEQFVEGVFQNLALAAINHPNRKAG